MMRNEPKRAKQTKVLCPICGERMIKRNERYVHGPTTKCDNDYYRSEWKDQWSFLFPDQYRDVLIGKSILPVVYGELLIVLKDLNRSGLFPELINSNGNYIKICILNLCKSSIYPDNFVLTSFVSKRNVFNDIEEKFTDRNLDLKPLNTARSLLNDLHDCIGSMFQIASKTIYDMLNQNPDVIFFAELPNNVFVRFAFTPRKYKGQYNVVVNVIARETLLRDLKSCYARQMTRRTIQEDALSNFVFWCKRLASFNKEIEKLENLLNKPPVMNSLFD